MSIISRIKNITLVLLFALTTLPSLAKDGKDLFTGLRYPELHVSPSASERLHIENDQSNTRQWKNHLMFQISAASTLVAGLASKEESGKTKEFDDAKTLTSVVGGGWLIGTTLMAYLYKPYETGIKKIGKLPNKTKKQKITRERIAEEYLHAPAGLVRTLKWASFLTNLGASINLAANVDDTSVPWVAVAGIASFLPLLFKHGYQHASDQHEIYKKKIYGPVFSTGFLQTPDKRETILGLQSAYRF